MVNPGQTDSQQKLTLTFESVATAESRDGRAQWDLHAAEVPWSKYPVRFFIYKQDFPDFVPQPNVKYRCTVERSPFPKQGKSGDNDWDYKRNLLAISHTDIDDTIDTAPRSGLVDLLAETLPTATPKAPTRFGRAEEEIALNTVLMTTGQITSALVPAMVSAGTINGSVDSHMMSIKTIICKIYNSLMEIRMGLPPTVTKHDDTEGTATAPDFEDGLALINYFGLAENGGLKWPLDYMPFLPSEGVEDISTYEISHYHLHELAHAARSSLDRRAA